MTVNSSSAFTNIEKPLCFQTPFDKKGKLGKFVTSNLWLLLVILLCILLFMYSLLLVFY